MPENEDKASGAMEPLIGRDIKWREIEGHLFRIVHFMHLAFAGDDKIQSAAAGLPYGFITVESPILNQPAMMPVNHREEFLNFWDIFQEDGGVPAGTELLVSYLPYRGFCGLILRLTMARLHLRLRSAGELERYYGDDSHWKRPSGREYFFPKTVVGMYCPCGEKLYTFSVRCPKCRIPILRD